MPPEKLANAPDHVNVIQLTDSHLFADDEARLLGLDTYASLNAVIDSVLAEHASIDLVLATGDIAQVASESAYQRFMSSIERLATPWYWLPGNHDDAELMSRLGSEGGFSAPWVDAGNWRLVMLDSSVSGSVAGYLSEEQLLRLEQALDTTRHVLVCLHHHPVPIGVAWMDPIGLRNASALLDRLESSPAVRGVLWGHVHQEIDSQRGNIRLLATPSTCIQFAPGVTDFTTDQRQPGYRWLRLHTNGRIETGVSRLAQGSFQADRNATGY
ncbi:3',5'-cyclic-AMP phosphodiesterase [Pseudomonas sp.]|uniref:3',5'-cyclic-AMP phosphodiesterase n=1 Tax=Pseudomonas sp. TaxID=306 RepID=UPI00272CA25D|nr:3',5'-cyclic-AMP phosphodiesterase [Pseudomonas sp.]